MRAQNGATREGEEDPAGCSHGRVPDDLSFDQVDHHLGEIGGVIRDPFDVFRNEGDPDGPADGLRLFYHIGEELPKNLAGQVVHERVVPADLSRKVGVAIDERIEGFFDHDSGPIRHSGDIDVGLELGFLGQFQRPLADILREVAHSLQIGRDLHRGGDEPQIARGGLAQGQEPDALLVDLHVVGIDLVIGLDHALGQVGVALHQRLDGVGHLRFDERPHPKDALFERGEFFVEHSHIYP